MSDGSLRPSHVVVGTRHGHYGCTGSAKNVAARRVGTRDLGEVTMPTDVDTDHDQPDQPADAGAERVRPRRRWLLWTGGFVLVIAVALGGYLWSEYRTLTSDEFSVVSYTVPKAPNLVAASDETVYRVDPTQSSLTYAVEEEFFGKAASTAKGTTNGIAGEFAVNTSDPSQSRVGQIVVNVEQLHSDNNLRDAWMRADNLESHEYPLAYLSVGDLGDLPIRPGGRQELPLHDAQPADGARYAGPGGLGRDGQCPERAARGNGGNLREDVDLRYRPDQCRGPRQYW